MEKIIEQNLTGNYLSLYEYLGYADKQTYGKSLYKFCKLIKFKPKSKEINTKFYNGPVLLYDKFIIDLFFLLRNIINLGNYKDIYDLLNYLKPQQNNINNNNNNNDDDDDDLPF